MRRYLKFVVLIVLVFVCVFGLYFVFNKGSNYVFKDRIVSRMDKKDSFNIYVTDDSKINENSTMDYYKDVYDMDIEYFNISKKGEKKYDALLDLLVMKKSLINLPFFVNIKNGEVNSSMVGLGAEENLKEYLVSNNLISGKYKDIDNILSDEEFNKIIKEKKDEILLYSNGSKEIFKVRKKLLGSNYKYSILSAGLASSIGAELSIMDKYENLKGICLIKIEKGKIVGKEENITDRNVIEKISKL